MLIARRPVALLTVAYDTTADITLILSTCYAADTLNEK